MDERGCWQQRLHGPPFHQGFPPVKALLSKPGRDAFARAELSAAGLRYVDTALRSPLDEYDGTQFVGICTAASGGRASVRSR
jgi:hypothetical protein